MSRYFFTIGFIFLFSCEILNADNKFQDHLYGVEKFRRKGFFDIISENVFNVLRTNTRDKLWSFKLYPNLKDCIEDLLIDDEKVDLNNIDSDKIIGEAMSLVAVIVPSLVLFGIVSAWFIAWLCSLGWKKCCCLTPGPWINCGCWNEEGSKSVARYSTLTAWIICTVLYIFFLVAISISAFYAPIPLQSIPNQMNVFDNRTDKIFDVISTVNITSDQIIVVFNDILGLIIPQMPQNDMNTLANKTRSTIIYTKSNASLITAEVVESASQSLLIGIEDDIQILKDINFIVNASDTSHPLKLNGDQILTEQQKQSYNSAYQKDQQAFGGWEQKKYQRKVLYKDIQYRNDDNYKKNIRTEDINQQKEQNYFSSVDLTNQALINLDNTLNNGLKQIHNSTLTFPNAIKEYQLNILHLPDGQVDQAIQLTKDLSQLTLSDEDQQQEQEEDQEVFPSSVISQLRVIIEKGLNETLKLNGTVPLWTDKLVCAGAVDKIINKYIEQIENKQTLENNEMKEYFKDQITSLTDDTNQYQNQFNRFNRENDQQQSCKHLFDLGIIKQGVDKLPLITQDEMNLINSTFELRQKASKQLTGSEGSEVINTVQLVGSLAGNIIPNEGIEQEEQVDDEDEDIYNTHSVQYNTLYKAKKNKAINFDIDQYESNINGMRSMLQDGINLLSGTSDKVDNIINTLEKTVTRVRHPMAKKAKPIYDKNIKHIVTLIQKVAYLLGAVMILLILITLFGALIVGLCPKKNCLGGILAVEFITLIIGSILSLILGASGVVTNELSQFLYDGDFVDFLTSDPVVEYAVDIISSEDLVDDSLFRRIVVYYWNNLHIESGTKDDPISYEINQICAFIYIIIEELPSDIDNPFLPPELHFGNQTMDLIVNEMAIASGYLEIFQNNVTRQMENNVISLMFFDFFDIFFIDTSRRFIQIWMLSLGLMIVAIPFLFFFSLGRQYWPKPTTDDDYEELFVYQTLKEAQYLIPKLDESVSYIQPPFLMYGNEEQRQEDAINEGDEVRPSGIEEQRAEGLIDNQIGQIDNANQVKGKRIREKEKDQQINQISLHSSSPVPPNRSRSQHQNNYRSIKRNQKEQRLNINEDFDYNEQHKNEQKSKKQYNTRDDQKRQKKQKKGKEINEERIPFINEGITNYGSLDTD